ncbi:flagellar biosynthesis protein FlhA [Orenia marismortui]|uniref:Flagellar biosynthesis protein FlhA n=1 Tax=Orenia marismortui TaxID=46469 RepID=A0A4R8H932_9FIRM|nr:flagellar biosynthesis protein FlhA [Orenia marismortui]TDX51914.1 flagellar biosynthesis protein FlhA [Orenia marismortui]
MATPMERLESNNFSQYSDVFFALAVIMVVVMFIIPLPTVLLDILLTLNISLGLTILLVSMYLVNPLELSVFPSLLLIATLFRLALNVSTTRLILGQANAGKVIEAFGEFVVGGNYVVGFVIFVILVAIQFIVITKGSERVAEVSARFTLDAMPGKQMSIDADLSSGLMTEAEARQRREEIRQEADFYGAMDGASKFVKGDAIAGIIITLINVLGGLIIGVIQMGMPITDALQTYTLLTVGDGLVSQVPALLISTATGIVVTRAASEGNLGQDFSKQLLAQPKTLMMVSSVIFLLGVLTPLPTFPFVLLAIVIGITGYTLYQSSKGQEELANDEEEEEIEEYREPDNLSQLLQVDPMELEVGYNLIPLVVPEQGGDLLDRVSMIRRQCALELGMIIPPIRIRDNMQLEPNHYRVNLRGIEIAQHEIEVDNYLAMDSGMVTEEVEGKETTEPAFGLPALWIGESQKERAEMLGYTVVDPPSVMATHLTELVKSHAYELLGRQEVKELIDNIKEDYSAVIDELIPDLLSIGQVQKVLQNLLKEGISIRDLVSILEVLADQAKNTQDTGILTEYVRQEALSRQISKKVKDDNNNVYVITLAQELEEKISNSIQHTEQGSYITLNPNIAQQIFNSLSQQIAQVSNQGLDPIVLTSPIVRYHFKQLTEQSVPNLTVLSFNELESYLNVQTVGMVKL